MTEYKPLFGSTSKFTEAFPEIESLTIEITPDRDGWYGRGKQRYPSTFTEVTIRAKPMSCENTLCERGGFNAEEFIRGMVLSKKTEHSDAVGCRGDEGSPQGRKKGKPCLNVFEVTAKIVYRNAENVS